MSDCKSLRYSERSRLERGGRSCDFPRHSGFYIFDLTFAYVQNQRSEILDQICLMTDYWWKKRDELGLLLIESRSPKEAERFFGNNAPTQTLSLGASLLESGDLMEPFEAELASKMRDYAKEYITGFLSARAVSWGRVFSLANFSFSRLILKTSAPIKPG